ncbi:MAG: hypothetical protein ACXWAV_02155 [Chthoniobacterales bacterium]
MITLRRSLILLATLVLVLSAFAEDQPAEFPGVKKAMSPGDFDAAGLNKLSPEERAKLDEFIRGYVSSTSEKAASAAVDKAVKNSKAMEPEVMESRIVGVFKGYSGSTRFTLENGQVWAQSQRDVRPYPAVDSPPVIIVKAGWGHRMYVLGGGNVRVTRMK